jgi:hypothetical protein
VSGWVTIWDVAAEPFRWGNAGEGLWAASSLFLGIAFARATLRRRTIATAALSMFVSISVAGALVWKSLEHQRHHSECVEASRQQAGEVLEGIVRDYRPLESYWQWPAEETFTLGDETMRLPLVREGCGYHRTTLEGGTLRDGMRVRLLAWRGQILRVEVDRDAALGVADAHDHR